MSPSFFLHNHVRSTYDDRYKYFSLEMSWSVQSTMAHPMNDVVFSVQYKWYMEWCNTGSRYIRQWIGTLNLNRNFFLFFFSNERDWRKICFWIFQLLIFNICTYILCASLTVKQNRHFRIVEISVYQELIYFDII